MKTVAHIILNPVAGGGKAKKLKSQLVPELEKRFDRNYLLMETTRQGDATIFAREAAGGGAGLIIAIGGDGTINEVLNGLLLNKKPVSDQCELGILNCGSGSGLAQTLRLPGLISDQLDLICDSTAKPLDVGFVNYLDKDNNPCERLFVSECQVGIGGSVVSRVGMRLKYFGGKIAFGSVALSHLVHYKASQMTIRLDQQPPESKRMIGVTIGNGIYCAGGMRLTPNARIDDGWLDVLQIHEMNLLRRFLNFGKVYSGNHINSTYFSIRQTKEISIDSERPIWIETDGELMGKTPCKIGVIPGAIRVRYKQIVSSE
ncbi:MAG: YegS/Rv2252/BmrU family lipid kinase [Bacteroidetes bacterium]|nr:YegS/Rv2252/BmrU family lipid kinase [Bacteroidota bacterium]